MLLDTRKIYLGKTTHDHRMVKIGLAKDVEGRWQSIDRTIKGSREKAILSFPVLNASWLERQLHRKYAKQRVTFKGSGKTEWFRLRLHQRLWLVLTLTAHGILFFIAVGSVGLAVLIALVQIVAKY